jgi:hypothetical protein
LPQDVNEIGADDVLELHIGRQQSRTSPHLRTELFITGRLTTISAIDDWQVGETHIASR